MHHSSRFLCFLSFFLTVSFQCVTCAYPWQALIIGNKTTLCGGVLVHPEWILTSASCIKVDFANFTEWTVILGTDNPLKLGAPGKQIYTAIDAKITVYENKYISNLKTFGLIKIPRVTKLTPIEISGDDLGDPANIQIQACGWGLIKAYAHITDNLSFTCKPFQLAEASICKISPYGVDVQVCVKDGDNNDYADVLDVGGPLIVPHPQGSGDIVVGIIDTLAYETCLENSRIMYVGVTTPLFKQWITDTINGLA